MNSSAYANRIENRYWRFFQIVDEIVEEIQNHPWHDTGKPKRRVSGEQLRSLRLSVETLIRDSVAVIYQRQRKGEVPIHLNRNWYSSQAAQDGMTHSIHIARAYNAMIEIGYLKETKKGVYDRQGRKDGSRRNRLTRYQATEQLIDKFTGGERAVLPVIVPPKQIHVPVRVQIKDDDGRKEVFIASETEQTLQMAANLERINRVLVSRWYDIEIPDEELAKLQAEMAEDPRDAKSLVLGNRQLYRVFNDHALKTGGRFYGGWWQNIPKAYRRHLIVNGKRMIEIDYSNMHPAMLYAKVGNTAPDDCYTGIFDKATERLGGDGLREMVKAAFNAMLNAENVLQRPPRGFDPKKFQMTWKQISGAIMEAHGPISQSFYSGIGSQLQRLDSDVAEHVMLKFIDFKIPILPIHDSFLVHEGHRGLLEDQMKVAIVEICGVEPKLKVVEADISRTLARLKAERESDPEGFGPDTTLDIAKILNDREGYDKRLDAFYQVSAPSKKGNHA